MQKTHSSINIKLTTSLLILLVMAAGCKKETVSYKFLVSTEVPAQEGAKTRLVDESIVLWENEDTIDIRSISGDTPVMLKFDNAAEPNGSLFVPLSEGGGFTEGDNTFIALFPHNDENNLGTGSSTSQPLTVVFPNKQPYVDDYTFGHAVCPMVAYGGEQAEGDVVRILFHNLCGLVRIQLRNTSDLKEIQSITFTSSDNNKPISGTFYVHDYAKFNPYVTKGESTSTTTAITNIRREFGAQPLTFYLSLPAVGESRGTTYTLQMHVVATDESKRTCYFSKQFSVPIRRNGITKMSSLTITTWGYNENESGAGEAGVAGNGTQQRPFLIYTAEDLIAVRDAFKNTSNINGYRIDEMSNQTWFKVMRSDIILTTSNWQEGIQNFRGHLIYGANQTSEPGITNNSNKPIFEKITASGIVENLAIKRTVGDLPSEVDESFSPLCKENLGQITNCRVGNNASFVMSNTINEEEVCLAGICVTNKGSIIGCGCMATLYAQCVAGICYENQGNIVGCYTSSPMRAYSGNNHAVRAAGICYNNKGTVRDCYFSANINTPYSTEWGGIAYKNSGTIRQCYIDASGIIQSTTTIGGIVNTMTAGLVEDCWNNTDLMNVQNSTNGGLGGIVYSLQGGEIRNCIRYRPTGSFTCTGSGVMGGFVARMTNNAAIRNCAFYGDISQSTSSKGAFVGNFNSGTIENAYGYQSMGITFDFYAQVGNSAVFIDCYGQNAKPNQVTVSNDLFSDLDGHTWSEGTTAMNYMRWNSDYNPPTLNRSAHFSKTRKR